MITYVKGNLFESPAQVLVNTVNTVGVMGKGIALEFKRIYPKMYEEYRALCEQGRLTIGKLHLYRTPHKWILNFPTKEHWRQPSKREFIERGLQAFVRMYADAGIHSIALPPLGCGHGQLNYETDVRPLIHDYLGRLPIAVFVYPAKPKPEPPEHRDVKAIRDWLRSEPAALPFSEVWVDLQEVIARNREFQTAGGGGKFTASVVEQPATVVIESAGKRYPLQFAELLEFWQQLRQYGFTSRSIAPKHLRVSYLIPLFQHLPYVDRVALSGTTAGLDKNAAALQVRPPAQGEAAGDLFLDHVGR